MIQQEGDRRNSVVGGLAVLMVRGVLVWIVVPAAALAWILIGFRLRRRGVGFSQYLGWVDVNLIALLQRTVLRPLVRSPLAHVPAREMPTVAHRLRAVDPV